MGWYIEYKYVWTYAGMNGGIDGGISYVTD